jgi:hypothetical protein
MFSLCIQMEAQMISVSAPDLIGSRPLVALDRIHRGPRRTIANVEFCP